MYVSELSIARSLALAAGSLILDLYATDFKSTEKQSVDSHFEPVTEADVNASRLIVEGLAKAFPGDAILSEEENDDTFRRINSERVWIVDPLDGTAGFVKRDGDFAVQIGFAENGISVLGVVYLPVRRVLYYAKKGSGSFRVENGGKPQKIAVSDKSASNELTLAMSRNHPSPRMGRIIETFGFEGLVRRGSVGLKVGLIAEQICDIYIHPSPRTKLWDTCAPEIILTEAGGRFTDLFGQEIRYDRKDVQNRNGILASNGSAHVMAVELLAPLLAEFGRVPYSFNR